MFHPPPQSKPSPVSWIHKSLGLLSVGLIALFGIVTACGGGDSSTPPPTNPATAVQINLGDAPADWVLAFSTTINSVTIHGSDGSVAVVNTAVPVELMQRMGTLEPLALGLANRGTYTSATVTFGDAHVTYIDPSTHTVQQKTIAGPFTAQVPFGSAVTLGTTPLPSILISTSTTPCRSTAPTSSPSRPTSTSPSGSRAAAMAAAAWAMAWGPSSAECSTCLASSAASAAVTS